MHSSGLVDTAVVREKVSTQRKVTKPSPLSLVRYKAKMKRIIFSLLFIIVIASQVSAANEPTVGRAAFFYLNSSDHEYAVYDDFSYHLNSISPWLSENNIVVSYYSKVPFEITLTTGKTLTFNANDFDLDLGFIFVRPNGQTKTYYGVHTDIEIMELAKEFINKSAL